MAATRNSNYYEMGLLHPKVATFAAPIYTDGYSDQISSIDKNGHVAVPEKPGMGVDLDWKYIEAHTVD